MIHKTKYDPTVWIEYQKGDNFSRFVSQVSSQIFTPFVKRLPRDEMIKILTGKEFVIIIKATVDLWHPLPGTAYREYPGWERRDRERQIKTNYTKEGGRAELIKHLKGLVDDRSDYSITIGYWRHFNEIRITRVPCSKKKPLDAEIASIKYIIN